MSTEQQHDRPDNLSDDPNSEGQRILKRLAERNRDNIYAAVSGGDDSIVALYFAYHSPHIELDGILHIDTGIGVPKTREYVESIADDLGLECYTIGEGNIRYPHEEYEFLVTKFGFPGANPIAHSQIQNNLKDKPFNRFESHLDGDLALISGVRKLESKRRYDKLTDLAENGFTKVKNVLWTSPIVEFSEQDLKTFKQKHDIKENEVSALLNSSGECLCTYEDRNRLIDLDQFYPEVAQQIYRLEFNVLEQVARGEVPEKYALWCHGSVDEGEYDARIDNEQGVLACADCEDRCGTSAYDMEGGDPLSPAEEFLRNNDLKDFWNWPFYCVACDRVIQSPYEHRQEVHDWDAVAGLEGYWDVRMVDVPASHECGRIITEPNGYNMHINHLVPSREKAANSKHYGYYEDYAITHCNEHDHDWQPHNGGPVRQCTECFAFDLTEYDADDPGPPILNPDSVQPEELTPGDREAQEIHQTLDTFFDGSSQLPHEPHPLPRELTR